jgi:hypothetical protein
VRRLSAAALAVAVVVTAASVYTLSGAVEPTASEVSAARQVPTTNATLACPESPKSKRSETSLLAVAPPAQSSAGSGSITVGALGDTWTPADSETEAGVPVVHPVGRSLEPAAVVGATGSLSAGTAAFEWSLESGNKRSGRSVTACAASSDDWWFNGVDTAVGSTSRLSLANTTSAIAVVDLEIFGPHGAVQTVGQRGIALAPDSTDSIDLARFAPGLDAASVHVHATAGLVTAAIGTSLLEGVTPAGSEWLPPAAEPTTDVVIDAAFDRSASQDLQIVNPDDVGALVQVQVVDDSGPFVPSGLEDVRIPPESVKSVKLGSISHNGPVSVRLTSPTPITGAVVSSARGGGDYAVSAPSPSLTDSAVVPVLPNTDLALQFTGSTQQSSGQFTVTGYDRQGQPVFDDTVTVDGLRTAQWTPPKKKGAAKAAYLVVAATLETPAQAVAQYAADDGIAALPLTPGVFSVTRPAVRQTR